MRAQRVLLLNCVCWVLAIVILYSPQRDSETPSKQRLQEFATGDREEPHKHTKPHSEPAPQGADAHGDGHEHRIQLDGDILQKETFMQEKDQIGAVGAAGQLRPGERPEVTREAFARRARNNIVLVTFANYQHRLFIVSLVRNFARLNIEEYIICAFDDKLMDYLIDRGIYAVRVRAEEQVKEEGLGWGSKDFIQLMRVKYIVTSQIIKWGFELLITDDDIGYLQNPLPYLFFHSRQADMLITTDNLIATTFDGGLELPTHGKPEFNSGFAYIRPTPNSIKFLDQMVANMKADPELRDQPALNLMMQQGYEGMSLVPGTRIFHAWNHGIRVGTLSTVLFTNGHTYFAQHMPQRYGFMPYTAHVTHVYSGDYGKRNRLREAKLFYDDLSYYADGKFLSFDFELPAELVKDMSYVPREKIPTEQVALGTLQVKQVLDAAIIARKLGRILLMPRTLCGCDRYWYFMDECRMNGANQRGFNLPFVCPMDHIFNLDVFERAGIEFREWGFLENRLVPREVLDSRVGVYMCDYEGGPRCADVSSIVKTADEVWVGAPNTDVWWVEKLKPYESKRIIHLAPMARVLTKMENADEFQRWKHEARDIASGWCCHTNGVVRYMPKEYE